MTVAMDVFRALGQLINRDVIAFAYGLVFFVLGLAIAFQSRHYSRLDLARSLSWLAAFGLMHGLYEWFELASPEQEIYLSPAGALALHTLHLIVLGAALACLFEFGIALLQPFGRGRWLRGFPTGLFIAWALSCFVVLPRVITDPIEWHNSTEALARYFIAFPGGMLAAYGLRQQTYKRIKPLNVPHIFNTLQVAGIALALYAVFDGLIPPPVRFFPGNVLNDRSFEQALSVPPSVFQSLVGLIMAITFIRALEVFDVETARMIEAMEQQQILSAERDRIARDLHDGVIQKVYTAGLLIKSAEQLIAPDSSIAGRMATAATVLNDAIGDLRRNIGELHPTAPSVSLPIALRRLAEDPRFQSLVDITLDLGVPDDDGLSPTRTEHVVAVVTEAMSNVVRHAHARRATISARQQADQLHVEVQDDGIGLPADVVSGYGLRNMRDRSKLLGGELDIASVSGKGTTVKLDIPWKDER
jgi:signal transduction histidine kinase